MSNLLNSISKLLSQGNNNSQLTGLELGNSLNELSVGGVSTTKVYRALLTQTGTNAPVATILENSIGNIVWSYALVGAYLGTLVGAFPPDKTFCVMQQSGQTIAVLTCLRGSGDEIGLICNAFSATPPWDLADNILYKCSIEIIVYP